MKRARKTRVDSSAARDRSLPHDQRAARAEAKSVEYDFHAKRSWAWRKVEALARSAKPEIALAALREFLKRTDPEPKSVDELERLRTEVEALSRRGLNLNIAIFTSGGPDTNGVAHHDAAGQLDTDRGTIRFVSGNGQGEGDHGVGGAG